MSCIGLDVRDELTPVFKLKSESPKFRNRDSIVTLLKGHARDKPRTRTCDTAWYINSHGLSDCILD